MRLTRRKSTLERVVEGVTAVASIEAVRRGVGVGRRGWRSDGDGGQRRSVVGPAAGAAMKLTTVAMFGAGYVLGTRAGRDATSS